MTFSPPTQRWHDSGRHVEIGGHRVFLHDQGSGPAVLLVHGFPTSSYDWRGVVDLLADTFRCVSLDLLGFGLSDKPLAFSYSLFQQTDIVEELARSLGIEEAHVVSHDVGTSLHTELLARGQEGRRSFDVLTSTFLNGNMLKKMAALTEFQRTLETPSMLDQALEMCERMVPGYVSRLQRIMQRPDVVTDDDATVMTEVLQYQDGNRRIPYVYSYVRERYLHKDRWLGALQAERAPLQFVWAEGDPIATRDMGRALAELVPRARYTEVARVGHFIPVEAPDVVAREVRALAAADGAGGA